MSSIVQDIAQGAPMAAAVEVESSNLTTTTNGDVAYTAKGVNAPLLALFFKLVRGLSAENMQSLLRPVVDDVKAATSKTQADALTQDLFVLMASTRGVRGGKGERDLFYDLFFAVGRSFPNQCVDMVKGGVVQHVGSFKDIKILYNQALALLRSKRKEPTLPDSICFKSFAQVLLGNTTTTHGQPPEKLYMTFLETIAAECIRVFIDQLRADLALLKAHKNKKDGASLRLSLAAKWAPRESKKMWKRMAKVLALQMHPCTKEGEAKEEDIARALKKYRKVVSRLNGALSTCEIKMCSGDWRNINPGTVPSQCLKRKRNAFLNLPNKKSGSGARSTDADRVQCAENFRKHLEKGNSVHGRAVHVNEIVAEYLGGTSEEDPVLEAQWRDIRKEFLEMDSGIRKYVAMADVSGSMFSGGGGRFGRAGKASPITCCVALSLLISEVAHPVFRNKVLTFDSNPTWFHLNEGDSLARKVDMIQRAPWGMSTDFYKGMRHIVQSCVEAGLTEEELPKGLVVFSDMQFDSAMHGDKADCMSQIEELWQTNGYASSPKIIFWNLAANTTSFPAKSDTKNVQMLSGFSQNLMKAFMNDTQFEEVTPETTLRSLLSEEWLDKVRDAFNPDSKTLEDPTTVEQRQRVQRIDALLEK